MFRTLDIRSPKRNSRAQTSWEGFFPYYAGYSETFAKALLTSANLGPNAVVFDPWNGSGTTTYTASTLGLTSRGLDINPVMVVVARARLLSPSEADSIEPIAKEVVRVTRPGHRQLDTNDPLRTWFSDNTAVGIRRIERRICSRLLGTMTITPAGTNLDKISGLAATFYVALFTVCRELASPFRCSNPTWLRQPKETSDRIDIPRGEIGDRMLIKLKSMAKALGERAEHSCTEYGASDIKVADTTNAEIAPGSADFILTSPPYCTRIDYTAATRVELAVISPLYKVVPEELSYQMIGSTRVPKREIEISSKWGQRCTGFLDALRLHPSKSSAGYYYKTHLDYFDKIDRSIGQIAQSSKRGGNVILIVQDSYYKEIHNDLPSIISDISEANGLKLCRREDFHLRRSMSGINPHTRHYKRAPGAVEAVLCFQNR